MSGGGVLLAVADACGDLFCVTFADHTPEHVQSFRAHARWWIRYAQSTDGRAALRRRRKYPAAPFRVIVEPYAEGECPPSLTRRSVCGIC